MTAFVDAGGLRTRVRVDGDPAQPPVVLLHGIGRSLEDWSAQQQRLADTHRVISLDLPGFGFSERLPDRTTLRGLADGVLSTLDALDEHRPVHLMGNSLGGAVSMRALVTAPSRVASLTLVNSAGFGREVTVALRVLAVPGIGRRLLVGMDREAARRTERALVVDRALVTDERIDHALRIAAQPHHAEVFLEAARELGTLRGVRESWRSELLAEVARHPRPTLVLWGERDLILPAHHLRRARALLPHAQSHVFADTAHMPQLERPAEFAALARPFLAAAHLVAADPAAVRGESPAGVVVLDGS